MRSIKCGAWGALALAMMALPVQAVAQEKRFELSGFGGSYVPTSDDGLELAVRDASRRGSIAWGGRLTYWKSKSVGVEVGGGYSPARITVATTIGRFPRSTDLWFGSGKVVLNLTPASTGLGFVIGGGVAAMHSVKTLVDPAAATTDLGGVASAGIRFPFMGVIARADVEDYFYGGNFGRGSKFTQDLVLSGGLSVAF